MDVADGSYVSSFFFLARPRPLFPSPRLLLTLVFSASHHFSSPPTPASARLRPPHRPPTAYTRLPGFPLPPRPPAATAASARLPGFLLPLPPPRAYALCLRPPPWPPATSARLPSFPPPQRAYARCLRPPSRRLRAPWSPTRQAEEKEERRSAPPRAYARRLPSLPPPPPASLASRRLRPPASARLRQINFSGTEKGREG
ncbi:hypothetical protein GUJ93_ZPchr0004g39380 [Zizania palustris]|uniref:Uncharacterized protein n=1 Tax=Zizania palustris TaxID=103762 RepID=A0A8J5VYZ8_ZIZPA|nr:hypothetical protein GUJ93_ZPchr0004g39380 [Zizania palustris]